MIFCFIFTLVGIVIFKNIVFDVGVVVIAVILLDRFRPSVELKLLLGSGSFVKPGTVKHRSERLQETLRSVC